MTRLQRKGRRRRRRHHAASVATAIAIVVGVIVVVVVDGAVRSVAHRAGRRRGGRRNGCRVAKSPMLGQRSDGAERLAAALTADLQATVGVHALVAAQVRKLGVGFQTDLALERLQPKNRLLKI